MTLPEHWSLTRTTLERLTLIGPEEDYRATLDWLHSQGFRVVKSGPYTDEEMWPKCDATRFSLVAEREVTT